MSAIALIATPCALVSAMKQMSSLTTNARGYRSRRKAGTTTLVCIVINVIARSPCDEAIQLCLRPWIASLALAMTDLEARFDFESDRRHPEEVAR